MKRYFSSVFARLTSWVKNIVAGTLPRTAVMAVIIASAVAFVATPAMAQELTEPTVSEVVTKGSNVRGDPSTDNDPVGTVPAGMTLTVTGCAGKWASVVAPNDEVGFIAGFLLNPNPCPQKAWGGIAPASGTGWGGSSAPAAAPAAAASPASSGSDWAEVWFPAIVWRDGSAQADNRYDVRFDPRQGGSADHPAYGWYYQPNLPKPQEREAHEVAVTLRGPALYRFTGPECRLYWNWDGSHPFDQGRLLIDRENVLDGITLQPTEGEGAEIWIFVKCEESAAGGFSLEALTPLP